MTRIVAYGKTDLTNAVADMVARQLKNGWTASRVAIEMHKLGFTWNEQSVHATTRRGQRRLLTVDEAVGLIAVFGGHTRLLQQEIDQLTALIIAEGKRR